MKSLIRKIYIFYINRFTAIPHIKRNSAYLARMEIDKLLNNINSTPSRLEHFGFKVYSQNDEDGIIEEIFLRLNIQEGVFCEVGVQNGLECNSLYLLYKGWRGLWVEGDRSQKSPILSKFKLLFESSRLSLENSYVNNKNINDVVNKGLSKINLSSGNIDFLSIDIDGMDLHLLKALNFKPKVICIEYNGKFRPNIKVVPKYDHNYRWTGSDYMGSSLLGITVEANKLGYTLVATNITGVNAFFVRSDIINSSFVGPFSATYLYNPPRYYLFQDYFSSIGHNPDFGPYNFLNYDC